MEISLDLNHPPRTGEELLLCSLLQNPRVPQQFLCCSLNPCSVMCCQNQKKTEQGTCLRARALVIFPFSSLPQCFGFCLLCFPDLAQLLVLPGVGACALLFQPVLLLSSSNCWHVVLCFSWHPTYISLLLSADLLPLDRRWIVCTLYS